MLDAGVGRRVKGRREVLQLVSSLISFTSSSPLFVKDLIILFLPSCFRQRRHRFYLLDDADEEDADDADVAAVADEEEELRSRSVEAPSASSEWCAVCSTII